MNSMYIYHTGNYRQKKPSSPILINYILTDLRIIINCYTLLHIIHALTSVGICDFLGDHGSQTTNNYLIPVQLACVNRMTKIIVIIMQSVVNDNKQQSPHHSLHRSICIWYRNILFGRSLFFSSFVLIKLFNRSNII